MALIIKHTITGSIDGSYLILQATNPESDYVEEGIDIYTDTQSIETRIFINGGDSLSYVVDPGATEATQFVTSGLKLYPSNFGLEVFEDGLYDSHVTWYVHTGNGDYDTTTSGILYGITEQSALKFIFDVDWKQSYRDINVYFNNTLKIKSWLSSIKIANSVGLVAEGARILKSLQKAIL